MRHEIIPFLGLRNPVSSTTHLIAAILAVYATYLLWSRPRGNVRLQITALCFGMSMTLQYLASATFHALQTPWEELQFFLLIDVCAIYLLIAGTYTPPLLVLLQKGWRRTAYVSAIWSLAMLGVTTKVLVYTGVLSQEPWWIPVLVFAGMAWFSPAILLDVFKTVGLRGLQWPVYAALAYAFGILAETRNMPSILPGVVGPHEVFHIGAIAGSFFHFVFIWNHVLPYGITKARTTGAENDEVPELAYS